MLCGRLLIYYWPRIRPRIPVPSFQKHDHDWGSNHWLLTLSASMLVAVCIIKCKSPAYIKYITVYIIYMAVTDFFFSVVFQSVSNRAQTAFQPCCTFTFFLLLKHYTPNHHCVEPHSWRRLSAALCILYATHPNICIMSLSCCVPTLQTRDFR